jgi:hypothetical protein
VTTGLQPLFITKPTDRLLDRLINKFAEILFVAVTYPTQSYYERSTRREKIPLRAVRAYRRIRSIAAFDLNHDTRWR